MVSDIVVFLRGLFGVEYPRRRTRRRHGPFEQRLRQVAVEVAGHPGRRVLVAGQPGAGKSTMIDYITSGALEPRPIAGGSTDATDWSFEAASPLSHRFGETMIVDSPGYGTKKHPVDQFLRYMPFARFDAIAIVVRGKLHKADEQVLGKLRQLLTRRTSSTFDLIVVRSFAEDHAEGERTEIEADIRRVCRGTPIDTMFVSARANEGIVMLRTRLLDGSPGAAKREKMSINHRQRRIAK